MTFLELMQRLEHRLGNHQLPLNPRATHLRELFEGIGVHHALMQRVVQAIYTQNGCRRLTDPVNRSVTLAAIGPIRLETLRASGADIDVYRLLDDLGTTVTEAFADVDAPGAPSSEPPTAEIIDLSRFRRRADFRRAR